MKRFFFTSALTPCMLVSAGMLLSLPARDAAANPQGGIVSAGSATIQPSGKQLDVYQQTGRAVIDWRSFDIAPDEHTRFHQPSSAAHILNRVNAPDPSRILGALTANGHVQIVNPNGVFFGKGSKVDVNGLIATTADIKNADYMAGRMRFDKPGKPNASVINEGTITAKEAGLVGLVAPNVANHGTITAKLGKVALASGDRFTLDMYGDGLLEVQVGDEVKSQLVSNTGRIEADGGTVALTAAAGRKIVNSLVRVEGEIEAPSVAQKGGRIIISAEGSNAVAGNRAEDKGRKQGASTILVSGRLDASGAHPGEQGGKIAVTGDHVGILSGARLDASGDAGGGNIRIGGEYRGKGITPAARRTIVQANTEINAGATGKGHGGRAIIWADERTDFAGNVTARGGALGGDGGFVETSGKQVLNATGLVDAGAAAGKSGTWLLDPNDIAINATANANVAGSPSFTTTDDNAVVTVASIQGALNAGTSVSVTTGAAGANTQNGDITVASSIAKTAGGDATLTLKAHRNITVNAGVNITSNTGELNMIFNSDGDAVPNQSGAVQLGNGTFTTNGGDLTIGGGANPTTTAAYGNAAINYGVYLNGSQINTGGGNISMRGGGWTGGTVSMYGVYNNTGSLQTSGNGTITLNGTGGGDGTNIANYGVYVNAGTVSSENGDVSITGTGGSGTSSNLGVRVSGTGGVIRAIGTGDVFVTGTGGGTTTDNLGIYVAGAGVISVFDGTATVEGTGSTAGTNSNDGIRVNGAGSAIKATGSGDVDVTGTAHGTIASNVGVRVDAAGVISVVDGIATVEGTGSTTGTSNNNGILVTGASSAIKATGNGDVSVTGTGRGTTTGNIGVQVDTAGAISVVDGAATVIGQGSTAGTSGNVGVYVTGVSSAIKATGSGAVNVTATGGGTTTSNYGVSMPVGGKISVVDGDLTLEAYGSTTGSGNGSGVNVAGGGVIEATGTGSIQLTAQGGGAGTNYGVSMSPSSKISVVDGDLEIEGIGSRGFFLTGAGVAIEATGDGNVYLTGTGRSGFSSQGVYVNGGARISVADGDLEIEGLGSATGTSSNYGVAVSGAGSAINVTGDGSVSVTGTGRGTTTGNHGVYVDTAGVISVGGGTATVIGTGSTTGTNTNHGIYVTGASSAIKATSAGAVNVTGTGGGSGAGANNDGVLVDSAGAISAVSNAVAVTGTGGSGGGGGHKGIALTSGGLITSTGAAAITVTGTGGSGGAGNDAIYSLTGGNAIGGASDTGNITLVADNLNLANLTVQTSGGIAIHPKTAGASMGVGSGAGTLSVTDAILGMLSWSSGAWLTLGDSATGALAINSGYTFAQPVRFLNAAGSDISLAGTLTSSSSGAGMSAAALLAAGRNFVNTGAFSMSGGGRRLIYSTNPASDTLGGLTGDFRRFTCAFGGACPSFPATGNGLLYSYTPTLSVTPSATSITYGDAVPALNGYGYALSGYLGIDAGSDAVTGTLVGATTYVQGNNVGTYNINYGSGTLASALGYGFSYANSANALTVGKKTLTTTADDKSRLYGAANPALTVSYSGWYGADAATDLDTAPTASTAATSASGVGAYTITPAGGSDNNYSFSYVNGTLTVDKAHLTVAADDKSKIYGNANPALTGTLSGFVNGEILGSSGVIGAAALSTVADATSHVGTYAIAAAQGTLAANNYDFTTFTDGTLTVMGAGGGGNSGHPSGGGDEGGTGETPGGNTGGGHEGGTGGNGHPPGGNTGGGHVSGPAPHHPQTGMPSTVEHQSQNPTFGSQEDLEHPFDLAGPEDDVPNEPSQPVKILGGLLQIHPRLAQLLTPDAFP